MNGVGWLDGMRTGVVSIGADRAMFMTALARHAPDVPVRQAESRDDDAMAEAVRVAADLAQRVVADWVRSR